MICSGKLPSKENFTIIKLIAEQYNLSNLVHICEHAWITDAADKELKLTAKRELEAQILAGLEDTQSMDVKLQLEDGIASAHKVNKSY